MIASPVPGQRWFFVLLVSAVAMTAWRAWPVAEEVPPDVHPDVRPGTYRYVPLLGLPLYDAVDDADGDDYDPPLEAPAGPVKTCLPFLAPILEHPNWQLRITSGYTHCFGGEIREDFTIASTGEVTWTKPGWPVRRLALSSDQLALVRRLDRLSCVELQPGPGESDWLSIGLDLGKYQEYSGARIATASTLGRAVNAMLEDLMEQYRRPRREVIGSMDLRLATTEPGAVYRARVTGGRVTVKRGRKLLVDEPVDPDQLIDLVDEALERRLVDEPHVKGVLLMHGWSVPVARLTYYERDPFEVIHRAIASARHIDTELRALGMRAYAEWHLN
jgi:hypothetical protein